MIDINHILDRAKTIAVRQGRLGRSPAEMDESGSVALCAGACIARAALELASDPELTADFNAALLTKDTTTYLPALFLRVGLSEELAKRVILENDRLEEYGRLSWFVSLVTI